MIPAAPLASGRTADVYALDGDRVLRRYRSGGDVRAEAEVMRHLYAEGYPVPRVHHADGPDLVLERVTGPTLVEALVGGDVGVRSAARLLVDLHARLHALPTVRATDPAIRILHLDLHPENVVLAPAGPVVIDWANAREGPSALDRAMTALILAEVAVDRSLPLSAAAHELLMAYVAEAGPLESVAAAARLRADLGAPDAARLPDAVRLVLAAGAPGDRAGAGNLALPDP
ncbi:tRNA A-37 threonylcarbamoyl transferase component Bud32 [Micromonospora viridifaciens]|uniref:tRNA A-37 threonylcarbamoyl transferase component Bud32 n=1 Tax=Micromonospora viridifaciens TaxID=1881 RepID=A0A1C4X8Z1_MICVI|nr:phosphotransferase [Micromonospora viridifaciens]SCF04960.1 tRNA A-37 threonylcarbamoyl transferase component Bud32 [Micromonospora viridifaciens]